MARLKDLPEPERRGRKKFFKGLETRVKAEQKKAEARKKASKPPSARKRAVVPKRASRTRRVK